MPFAQYCVALEMNLINIAHSRQTSRMLPRVIGSPGGFGFHSITSSARLSNAGEKTIPSDFAVFRLIASLNLTGCSTGRSLGLAPRKILAT
jgi:hypothetical protein